MADKQREFRVYAPNVGLEDIQKLKDSRAAVMVATVPKGALFLGIQSVPTAIDLLGFSSGGGPPGYAYWVDPNEEEMETHFFTTVVPNVPLDVPSGEKTYVIARGTTQAMGVVLCCLELVPQEGTSAKEIREQFETVALVIDAEPYEPPGALLQQMLPKQKEG